MKVAELKPGMLLRPKKGFEWRQQRSVYLEKMMCLTVERCPRKICEDNVVIYVGEREDDDMSYGKLYPCGLIECLPGDTFDHSTSALVRLSPLAVPVMHDIMVRIHHFFVPHRLAWAAGTGDPGGS